MKISVIWSYLKLSSNLQFSRSIFLLPTIQLSRAKLVQFGNVCYVSVTPAVVRYCCRNVCASVCNPELIRGVNCRRNKYIHYPSQNLSEIIIINNSNNNYNNTLFNEVTQLGMPSLPCKPMSNVVTYSYKTAHKFKQFTQFQTVSNTFLLKKEYLHKYDTVYNSLTDI